MMAERLLGTLLELDNRLLDRVDPVPHGPLDAMVHPWSVGIEKGWPDIRSELDLALEDGVRMPDTDQVVGTSQGAQGRWSALILFWHGCWQESAQSRFPRTVALLEQVPELQIAGFTVLGPGAHLPLHEGPIRSLRYHLGVRVPDPPSSSRLRIGDTTVPWADGESVAFDDRTPHEAWNDSAESRFVLFAQTRWEVRGPARLFHAIADAALARATRGVASRVDEYDLALNPQQGE